MRYEVTPHVALLLTIFGTREPIDLPGLRQTMDSVLSSLTPFEQRCLDMAFGLSGNAVPSHGEIAKALNSSPQHVDQSIKKAFRELRHPTMTRQLLPFINEFPSEQPVYPAMDQSYPIEKCIVTAKHGLLPDNIWEGHLWGYDTRLIRWLRAELCRNISNLREKFNYRSQGQLYFGYCCAGPPDRLYVYPQKKKLVIDIKLDQGLSKRLRSLGYNVSLRQNWQGRVGWLTGWDVPYDTPPDKWQTILKVLQDAF